MIYSYRKFSHRKLNDDVTLLYKEKTSINTLSYRKVIKNDFSLIEK